MSGPATSPREADGSESDSLGAAGESLWADIDGMVRYIDFGGPSRGPVIVCVHGLAGGAVNWSAIAPLLTGRCRVLAPDLAGHGLTRSGGRSTDVHANTLLLHRFIERVCGAPVILIGNSMGGMISLLEASAAADQVSGLILIDPALPFVPARPDLLVAALFVAGGLPGLGPFLLRGVHHLSPEAIVARTLALCCRDPSRVPASVVAQHVAVAERRAHFAEVGHDIAVATRSVIATAGPGGHAYRRGIAALSCPVLLLHGEHDRLVPVSAARVAARAYPSWSLIVLGGVGHVPQLEAPNDCADAILSWLDSGGQSAARGASAPPRSAAGRLAQRWRRQGEGSACPGRSPGPGDLCLFCGKRRTADTECDEVRARRATARAGGWARPKAAWDELAGAMHYLGAVVLVLWLIIGAIAAGQRLDYTRPPGNCSQAATITVTILAGPLNYVGVDPKISCKHVPQPSK